MTIVAINPTSAGRRHQVNLARVVTKGRPEKALLKGPVKKSAGRNYTGRVTVRHHGGGAKRQLRLIDWKRDKIDVPGKIMALEYDPNRTAAIALVFYADGEKRYILAPYGIKVGDKIKTSNQADIKPGNTLPLKNIPIGTPIHNLELTPGKGGQLVRSAGAQAFIQSKEKDFAAVLLPSKEIRLISNECFATIGQLSNPERRTLSFGKAGRRRHLGWRPTVRGVAQHPDSHPHGGGEGRSGVGLPSPKSPWGKPTLGKKTRRDKKYSDKYIVKDRRKK
ncbi:MAG: 50S ribosomal protein L2 [Candidatus Chisholmbacteria bacterium]|nr:50S ribosomal protein L2 [Candidatus Chisholmbacteria bacterium]